MVVMSGVSVLIAGISIRGSQRGQISLASTAAAPAGVVGAADPPTAVTASTAPTRPPSPTAVARAAAPSPTTVPRRILAPSAPRPVATRSAPRPSARPTPAQTTTVVNGAPADTRYGPVQVQISIRGRRIIRADAIDYPQGSGRDQEINSYAIPQLDQETVNAQSANIDTVSGATYTSDGYRQSLQSALDAAHRAGAW
ncbi:MAG: hypothetical protein QOI82_3172 [Actinomycetota bacterium]|nr:hypothetical protein [Actinomycetota bacterium]